MTPAAPDGQNYVRTPEILALIRRVVAGLLIVTGSVGAAGIAFGLITAGWPGLWAALIAAVMGLFFTGTTVAGLHLAAGRGGQLLMIVLLGGWMMKMIVLAGVMFWLRGSDFYDRNTFVATIITLVIGALLVEMIIVARANIPYVSVSSVTTEGATSTDGGASRGTNAQETADPDHPGDAPAAGASDEEPRA